MTLLELSVSYRASAAALHGRITELRALARTEQDPEAARLLRRRVGELLPLWREMRELASLTAHYYDRGYGKHERYTL